MATRTVEFREHFLSIEGSVSLSQRDLKAMREGERRLHGGHNRKAERAAARRERNGTLQIRAGEVTHEEVPEVQGVVFEIPENTKREMTQNISGVKGQSTPVKRATDSPASPYVGNRIADIAKITCYDPVGQSIIDDVICETPKVTRIRIYSVAPATTNPNRRPWDGNIEQLISDLDVSTVR